MSTILITGASSGIGRATAELFLSHGWTVGLMARRREALEAVAKGYDTAHVLPGDVTREEDVDRVFDAFAQSAGRIDVLFNNAGVFGSAGEIDDVPVDIWREVVDVNLTGMFLCARAAYRHMRRQDPKGGRIINNGSISAYVPREGAVCYSVTKHAITGLTRQLALDGRAHDIACGQIDIGNAQTELLDGLVARAQAENPGMTPPPMMDVEDAARSVLHMATLPVEANVLFMTVMATKMPYVGRG